MCLAAVLHRRAGRENLPVAGLAYTMTNPRYANGNLRRKYRARLKAQGAPCAICGMPIDYDAPSDSAHPLSFVIDEIIPISRSVAYGYESRAAAAQDWENLQPAHWVCNARKSNKIVREGSLMIPLPSAKDGDW